MDLHLDLAGSRIREALERALRDAARTGRLAPGLQLPASRALAADLGVSRNTVAEAYGQLIAEGWLTARPGAGTYVADRSAAVAAATAAAPPASRPPYDLRAGSPDTAAFPRPAWLAATRRALATAPAEALGYTDPQGRPELRQALAGYLARARGVQLTPDRLVICSGFTQGLGQHAPGSRSPASRPAFTCCSNYPTATPNPTSSPAPPATAWPSKGSPRTSEPPAPIRPPW